MGEEKTRQICKILIRFLKEQNLFKAFINEYNKKENLRWRSLGNRFVFPDTAQALFKRGVDNNLNFDIDLYTILFGGAFNWKESKQGFWFWAEVNRQWRRLYDSLGYATY